MAGVSSRVSHSLRIFSKATYPRPGDKRCVTVEKTQKSFDTVEKTRGILAGVQADWGLNCVAFEKTDKNVRHGRKNAEKLRDG